MREGGGGLVWHRKPTPCLAIFVSPRKWLSKEWVGYTTLGVHVGQISFIIIIIMFSIIFAAHTHAPSRVFRPLTCVSVPMSVM